MDTPLRSPADPALAVSLARAAAAIARLDQALDKVLLQSLEAA